MMWPNRDNDRWFRPRFKKRAINEFRGAITFGNLKGTELKPTTQHTYNVEFYERMMKGATERIKGGHAKNTKKCYKSDVNIWLEFHETFGGDPHRYSIRFPGDKMLAFAQWRATTPAHNKTEPCQPSTLKRNLYGIQCDAIENQYIISDELPEISASRNPKLWALLDTLEEIDHSKKPIRAELLSQMISTLNPASRDDCVRRAVWSIAHNTMRRGTETTQENENGVQPVMVEWQNGTTKPLHYTRGRDKWVSIHFDRSKTNHSHRPQSAFLWCRCKESADFKFPCGFCAFYDLYKMRRYIKPKQQLFEMTNGKTYRMTQFREDLQMAYHIVTGEDKHDIATHSLRSGGYQDAKAAGQSEALILEQAYWKSMESARPYEEKDRTHRALDALKESLIFN